MMINVPDRLGYLRVRQGPALRIVDDDGLLKHWAQLILDSSPHMDQFRFMAVSNVPVQKDESQDPYDHCVALVEIDEDYDMKAIPLVVICITDDEDVQRLLSIHRLSNCIRDSINCEYGIIMSARVAFIFKNNHSGGLDQIGDELDLVSDEGLNKLLAFTDEISKDRETETTASSLLDETAQRIHDLRAPQGIARRGEDMGLIRSWAKMVLESSKTFDKSRFVFSEEIAARELTTLENYHPIALLEYDGEHKLKGVFFCIGQRKQFPAFVWPN